MDRIHPERLDAESSDRSAHADLLLREEPDEDDEEDEGDSNEDGDDDEDDDGYSE